MPRKCNYSAAYSAHRNKPLRIIRADGTVETQKPMTASEIQSIVAKGENKPRKQVKSVSITVDKEKRKEFQEEGRKRREQQRLANQNKVLKTLPWETNR